MNSGLLGNVVPNPLISAAIKYNKVPIDRLIHLYEPERAQQHRGIGCLYPVLRTVQDLHELNYLEKLAAKDAARTSAWITNSTGQASPRGLRAMQLAINSLNANAQAVQKSAPQYFETVEGAERQYLKTGEDVKFLASQRPSVCVQWFYDYLVRQICAGTGISALLVMPWSLQGTVTRADLDIMSGFFRGKSAVAIGAIRELYVWVMSWATRFDRSLDGYPSDWADVTARPPRSPNVDVGRNSAAMIAEYEEGFRSLQDICSELGHDWRQVIRQKAIEAKFIKAMAEEFGVEPEKISKLAQQSIGESPDQEPKSDSTQPDKTVPTQAAAELAEVL
jgi:capsid protein